MKTIKRELVKVGTFGRMGGQQVTITPAILADIKSTFDGKCPVTLGHQLADWMPKFGNAAAIAPETTDNSIVSNLDVHDLLADAINEKLYDDLSVGIEKNLAGKHYLHHVAFLGAVPPKIRDLKVFGDMGFCYLADGPVIEVSHEEMLSKEKQDPKTTTVSNSKEEDVDQQLKNENEVLKKQLADANATTLVTAKANLAKAIEGKVPKGKHSLVMALADQLGTSTSIELSDDAGAKTTVTGVDLLARIFEAIPGAVSEGRSDLGDGKSTEKPLDMAAIMSRV